MRSIFQKISIIVYSYFLLLTSVYGEPIGNDPKYKDQWYLKPKNSLSDPLSACIPCLDIEKAWKYTKGSKFVKTTVIEMEKSLKSVLPTKHPDLIQYNYVNNQNKKVSVENESKHNDNKAIKIIKGPVYGNPTKAAGPMLYHDTQILGLIIAQHNNGIGIKGISPNISEVRLISMEYPGHDPNIEDYESYTEKLTAMNESIVTQEVNENFFSNVYNCSFADIKQPNKILTYFNPFFQEATKVGYSLRDGSKTGSLFVISAGNEGVTYDFPSHPIKNVIIVGAVNNFGKKTAYSNFGEAVEIFAPSGGVPSGKKYDNDLKDNCLEAWTRFSQKGDGAHKKRWGLLTASFCPKDNKISNCDIDQLDQEKDTVPCYTEYATGTSMAAPIVTSIANLMFSINPELHARTIKKILISSAYTLSTKTPQPYQKEIKVVNPESALKACVDEIVYQWSHYWEKYFKGNERDKKIFIDYYDHQNFECIIRTGSSSVRQFVGRDEINMFKEWMVSLKSLYGKHVVIEINNIQFHSYKDSKLTVNFDQNFYGGKRPLYKDRVHKTITFCLDSSKTKDSKWWYICKELSEGYICN